MSVVESRMPTIEIVAALVLAAVGGYGDAASFLLVGCFTGHVTGNMVLTVVALMTGRPVWEFLLGVMCFLCATSLTQRLSFSFDSRLGRDSMRFVLIAEIVLLVLAPNLLMAHHRAWFISTMSVALGMQNGALSEADGVKVRTTYLTGTITHLLGLVVRPKALRAVDQWSETKLLFAVWVSFILGVFCGGWATSRFGPKGVWGMPLLLLSALVVRFLRPNRALTPADQSPQS